MKTHCFDVEDAINYGVNEALVLYHIRFWTEKNAANDKHFYDGCYWTYSSIKAFTEVMPYFSEHQVRRYLDKLRDAGAIQTGNFGENKYDHTLWYSCFVDLANSPRLAGRFAKTLIKTDAVTDTITLDASHLVPKRDVVPVEQIVQTYNDVLSDKLPKAQQITTNRQRAIKCRWKETINSEGPKGVRYSDVESGIKWWSKFFSKVKMNPHWIGDNDRGWCADLDWILKPTNFTKVLEYVPADARKS